MVRLVFALMLCVLGASGSALIAAVLALRRAGLVPRWQWISESVVAGGVFVSLAVLLFVW